MHRHRVQHRIPVPAAVCLSVRDFFPFTTAAVEHVEELDKKAGVFLSWMQKTAGSSVRKAAFRSYRRIVDGSKGEE